MRRCRVWKMAVGAMVCLLAACVTLQAQQITPSGPRNGFSYQAGQLYASNFGQWQVVQGNLGPFSWNNVSYCLPTEGGTIFNAFTVGTPVMIVDRITPANSEIVTPTAVRLLDSSCSIDVAPVHGHTSFYFTSATGGLQEALNWARTTTYTVLITPDWTLLGGLTSTITSAQGNTSVSIQDQRTACFTGYLWNGSAYIAQANTCSGGSSIVDVNGVPITNPNFNGTTPAAEPGYSPVKFQVSGSNVSAEVAVPTIVNCLGIDDTAALQAAFNAAGRIEPIGSCVQTAHLIEHSNTYIDWGQSTLTYAPVTADYMVINAAALAAAQRTFTDGVVASGSTTITSATANFVAADVNQSIDCLTAAGAGASYDLHTTIVRINSTSSILINAPAGASVNPATCNIYYRDTNIVNEGGTFIETGSLASAASWEMFRIQTINNALVENATFIEPGTAGRGHLVFMDYNSVTAKNNFFQSFGILQDGIDLAGPGQDGYIQGVHGYTGDDFTAILANPCFSTSGGVPFPNCTFGQVSGVVFDDIDGTTLNVSEGVKVRSGAAASILDISIHNVKGEPFSYGSGFFGGFGYGVGIQDEAANQTGSQGSVSGVKLDGCSGVIRTSCFWGAAQVMSNLTALNLTDDLPSNTTKNLVDITQGVSATATVLDTLLLNNIRPNTTLNQNGVHLGTNVTVQSVQVSGGSAIAASTSATDFFKVDSGAVLKNYALSNIQVDHIDACVNLVAGSTVTNGQTINLYGTNLGTANSCQNTQAGLAMTAPITFTPSSVGTSTLQNLLIGIGASGTGVVVNTSLSTPGSGYTGTPSLTQSGGTCSTAPVLADFNTSGTLQFIVTTAGVCSVLPTVTLGSDATGTGAGLVLAFQGSSVQATSAGVPLEAVNSGSGTNAMAYNPTLQGPILRGALIASGVTSVAPSINVLTGSCDSPFMQYSGSSLMLIAPCGAQDTVSFFPAKNQTAEVTISASASGHGVLVVNDTASQNAIDFNPAASSLAKPQNSGLEWYLSNANILVVSGYQGGTGYTGSGACAVSGGVLISGTTDTCTTGLSGGVITLSFSGTGVWSTPPVATITGATGGSGATLVYTPFLNGANSVSGSFWQDVTASHAFHWTPLVKGTTGSDWMNVSGTAFAVTGIKSGSGSSCLQIDTAGNITNDGSPCGTGSPGVASINTNTGAFTFTGAGVSCTGTTCTFSGSGTTAFSSLTSGTNTTMAAVIGTGASLSASGSGTIAATTALALASVPTLCSTGQAPTGVLANGNATGCAAIGGSGFPITIGSTSIASGSTTTTINGLSLNVGSIYYADSFASSGTCGGVSVTTQFDCAKESLRALQASTGLNYALVLGEGTYQSCNDTPWPTNGNATVALLGSGMGVTILQQKSGCTMAHPTIYIAASSNLPKLIVRDMMIDGNNTSPMNYGVFGVLEPQLTNVQFVGETGAAWTGAPNDPVTGVPVTGSVACGVHSPSTAQCTQSNFSNVWINNHSATDANGHDAVGYITTNSSGVPTAFTLYSLCNSSGQGYPTGGSNLCTGPTGAYFYTPQAYVSGLTCTTPPVVTPTFTGSAGAYTVTGGTIAGGTGCVASSTTAIGAWITDRPPGAYGFYCSCENANSPANETIASVGIVAGARFGTTTRTDGFHSINNPVGMIDDGTASAHQGPDFDNNFSANYIATASSANNSLFAPRVESFGQLPTNYGHINYYATNTNNLIMISGPGCLGGTQAGTNNLDYSSPGGSVRISTNPQVFQVIRDIACTDSITTRTDRTLGIGLFVRGVNLNGTSSPLLLNGSAGTSGNCALSAGTGNTPTWGSCGVGSGTVTSVGWTGGIVSVASPTTTPAFTIAGTSGGIPYFSSTSTWTSSAVLPAGDFMLGGGAGSPPTATFSIVPIANGGTGTASPGLVAGTNITITGSWPNQTINSSAGGGTVTHTAGALTLGLCLVGNGSADIKSDANCDDGITTAGVFTYKIPINISDSTDPNFIGFLPNAVAPAVQAGAAGWGLGATLTTAGFYEMPDAPGTGFWLGTNSSGIVTNTFVPEAGAGAGVTTGPTSGTTAGHIATFVGTNGQIQDGGAPATGTVTSVAQTFTGGLISVGGSPVTTSGTLALTVAGTSGGIPYFASGSTWATSAALTANGLVLGGGAGTAPSTVAGITTDGVSKITLGVSGTSVGGVVFNNASTGAITLAPATGALGTVTATLPANTGTLAELNLPQTFSALQTFSAGINLSGASSPLQVGGSAGTSGNCFLSAGTGATPTWGSCGGGGGLPTGTTGQGIYYATGGTTGTATSDIIHTGATAGSAVGIGNLTPLNTLDITGGFGLLGLGPASNPTANGSFTSAATTIAMSSTTSLPNSGYGAWFNNQFAADVISWTGISGGNLTGVTHGLCNSSPPATRNTGATFVLIQEIDTFALTGVTCKRIDIWNGATLHWPTNNELASTSPPGSNADIFQGAVTVHGGIVSDSTYASTSSVKAATYLTNTNCNSNASPAVCAAAPNGGVAVPAGTGSTLVVNTTAVTASSQIFLQIDDSLTVTGATCNTTFSGLAPYVSARTAGTSFTITVLGTSVTNPVCVAYKLEN
jgi:hypothetical protein